MKNPIIPIPRVNESWLEGLITVGILEVTEEGLKCKENVPATDGESA